MATEKETKELLDTEENRDFRTPSPPAPSSPPPASTSSSLSSSQNSGRDSGVENDVENRKKKHHGESRGKKERTKKDKEENEMERKEVKEEDEIFFNENDEETRVTASDMHGGFSTMGYFGPVPLNQHHVSAQRRKIIQEILAQFDLETVMDRYRGDSVRTSLRKRQFRQWLERMMGSQEIQWNDREWNEQFRQKVLQDFEKKQDEKERRLAEAESQRILKLKLLGIIRDEEEEARRHEMENRKTPSERKFERRTTKKHQSIFKPNDIESQMEILSRDENEVRQRYRRDKQDDEGDEETGTQNNSNKMLRETNRNDSPNHASPTGYTDTEKKSVHPNLKDLYQKEDLDQLYREAENLVKRSTKK